VTTPEQMQELARRYLVKDRSWRLAVVPAGDSVAGITARR